MDINENITFDDIETHSFEKHIETITKALEMLEDENISLHKSMEIYKEGKKAIMQAQKILDNAKQEFCEIDNKE